MTDPAATEDRCVVCHLGVPRHGGLCCAHRYDEQPRCTECPTTTAATVTVERHDLNAAWSIIVVYASRVRDDDARAHADALAARLRAILEATDGT